MSFDITKQRRIESLFVLAKQLELSNERQITALSPIKKLITTMDTALCYYLYLLNKSFGYYQLSQSLTTIQLISDSERYALYLNTIETLQSFIQSKGSVVQEHKLIEIYEYFQQQFPGWKRISVHATRRRIGDPDLLLLERTVGYVINHWLDGSAAYELSRYYCCQYKDYRLKITKESAIRITDIAQYFK